MIGADAQSLPNHPEGGNDHYATLSHGISQVFVTLAKLTAITLVILFFQKGIDLLKKMKPKVVQR